LSSDSFGGNYLKRGIIFELLNTLSAVEMLHDAALYEFMIDIDIDTSLSNVVTEICIRSRGLYVIILACKHKAASTKH